MTDQRMEKHIADAVAKAAPDMIDDLMSELGITDEMPVSLRDAVADDAQVRAADDRYRPARQKRSQKSSWKRFVTAAAALVLFAGGLTAVNTMNSRQAMAFVGIDVNPSVEMTVDRNEKVTDVSAYNDDGTDLLDGMKLKGCDIEVACNALIGSMLTKGYLTDTSNSVLVSVRASDEAKGRDIEKQLADSLNRYFENTHIAAAILGQYVQEDDELSEFAETNGISVGKAWLIRSLMQTGSSRMTEESLLKLSTQDLILLGQERKIPNDASYGNPNTSNYIGEGKALEIALENAGVSRPNADGIEISFDCDDGMIVYEIEFYAGGYDYEYEVDAVSGSIVSSERDGRDGDDDDDDRDDDDDWDDDDD